MKSFLFLAVVVIAGCAGPSAPPAQRAYIERLGDDTTAIEVFTRTDDGFEGDLLVRLPVTRVAHYVGTLSDDGTISRLEVEWRTPDENPDGPDPERFVVTMDGDSATVVREAGGEAITERVAVPAGAIPQVGKSPWSYAVFEQAARQAVASGSDSFPVTFLSVGGRGARATSNAVTRHGRDSISLNYFGSPMLVNIDSDGRILGLNGEESTNKVAGEFVLDVDLASLAADFAARDARGEGIGQPSPRGRDQFVAGGATIELDYGRPSKRGRDIFGGLVPFDEVWRTGANTATHFTTDRDLMIGGTEVPVGVYTLWTTFTATTAHLIINKQTRQWGTDYDETQDLARIEMTRESLDETVEQFTMLVEPGSGGGTLQLRWDRTQFSVPIRVR